MDPNGFCPHFQLAIPKLDLRNIDNLPLHYLSVSPHPYFGGNTRINGTITVKGREGDQLSSLDLDVMEKGARVAVANLAPAASKELLHKPFGPSGVLQISTPQLLFNLPSSHMGGINQTTDGNLTLTAVAQSSKGESASKSYGPVAKLVRYTGSNRFFSKPAPCGCYDLGDADLGGDDWVLPSVIPVLKHFAGSLLYGDMSKMNGGPFPQHMTHDKGIDVDAVYADHSYSPHTAASALKMLSLLNDLPWGSRIGTVYVTFSKNPPDAFWNTIRNVVLADGRRACRVFRSVINHGGHFHWRIDYQDHIGSC